ncbi:hypothetical protein [Streptomyces sp. NPDC051642]|uniref:hypothetical protein n=1 Tax=unclassified Streptomyces TaxID=2593676 RepID=UPI00342985A5
MEVQLEVVDQFGVVQFGAAQSLVEVVELAAPVVGGPAPLVPDRLQRARVPTARPATVDLATLATRLTEQYSLAKGLLTLDCATAPAPLSCTATGANWSGLELAIARDLARCHDGTLSLMGRAPGVGFVLRPPRVSGSGEVE